MLGAAEDGRPGDKEGEADANPYAGKVKGPLNASEANRARREKRIRRKHFGAK